MAPRYPQRAFSGGMMSSTMYSRTDVNKWQQGLKDAVNILLLPEGGVAARPGTFMASGYDTSSGANKQWLIPFEASEDDTYVLEFGAGGDMRVLKDGAYVLDSSFTGAITGVTNLNPAQIVMSSPAEAAKFTVGRLVYFTDPNGTCPLHQSILEVTAISGSDLTFKIVGGVTVDNTGGDWDGVDAGGGTLYEVFELSTPYSLSDMPYVQFAQDVDTLFMVHRDYPVKRLTRIADDNWTIQNLAISPEQQTPAPAGIGNASVTNITQANPGVVTVSSAHGFPAGTPVVFINVTGMTEVNKQVYYVGNPTSTTFELHDRDGDNVDTTSGFTTYVSGGTVYTFRCVALVGSGSTEYRYKVSAVSAETGEESLPSDRLTAFNDLTTAGNQNQLCWPDVEGATYYRVYKEFNQIYGYIGVTQGNEFIDENITPDTAENPKILRNPVGSADDRPGATAFLESRLALASTNNNPQAVELSGSISPLNFNRALTPVGSDAISFRLRSQKLDRIYHIIAADQPILLTAGAEWILRTADSAPLQPGNFGARPVSYRGSARIPRPLTIGNQVLHVTREGNKLREFPLDLRAGQNAQFKDLTMLIRSFVYGRTITSMAYAQSPYSVVWVTLSDGSCYSLAYVPEHEIWGWTRQTFGGADVTVHQVTTVTEGYEDVPYFVIERTIDGQSVTCVERMQQELGTNVELQYFVDGGSRYLGTAATTLRGFLHLRGEAVSVLSNGDVVSGVTVGATGKVTLANSGTVIAVGLGRDAYIRTLPFDLGDQLDQIGASLGRPVSAAELAIRIVFTRGVKAGPYDNDGAGTLYEVKPASIASPLPLRTETVTLDIQSDWAIDQGVEVRQTHPLPMIITAVGPEVDVGGD